MSRAYRRFIRIDGKVQASNSILSGTKAGSDEGRIVPIPAELVRILADWRAGVAKGLEGDFVFTDMNALNLGKRGHYAARVINNWVEAVRARAKVHCTVHGLRHTYGREFAMRGGNIKALQAILGHSSSQMTDRYSNLGGQRLKAFGETVSFDQQGVKKGVS